jgi:hypothetical protein
MLSILRNKKRSRKRSYLFLKIKTWSCSPIFSHSWEGNKLYVEMEFLKQGNLSKCS